MSQTVLSERIGRILSEQKLKNVAFAKTLGISANYVSLLAGGKKNNISQTLAKLIETTYGYCAEWVLTGREPIHLTDTFRDLQESTIDNIMRMNGGELRAVAAYIRTLNDFMAEEISAQTETPLSVVTEAMLLEKLTTLTVAERRVYDLLVCGSDIRKMAETLGLSVNTIKTHLKGIYKKLGVRSSKELLSAMSSQSKVDL